ALQVSYYPDRGESAQDPLRRIEVVEAHPVSVVPGKGVEIVVVALSHRQQGYESAIPRGAFGRIRLPTGPVGQRVDREGHVVAEDQTPHAAKEQPAQRIAKGRADGDRQEPAKGQGYQNVVTVLKPHQSVRLKIGRGHVHRASLENP